jgi:hypothetical protein
VTWNPSCGPVLPWRTSTCTRPHSCQRALPAPARCDLMLERLVCTSQLLKPCSSCCFEAVCSSAQFAALVSQIVALQILYRSLTSVELVHHILMSSFELGASAPWSKDVDRGLTGWRAAAALLNLRRFNDNTSVRVSRAELDQQIQALLRSKEQVRLKGAQCDLVCPRTAVKLFKYRPICTRPESTCRSTRKLHAIWNGLLSGRERRKSR